MNEIRKLIVTILNYHRVIPTLISPRSDQNPVKRDTIRSVPEEGFGSISIC